MDFSLDYPAVPAVTVILPVYNEQRYIQRCLEAIQAQDYPTESLEILVIDGRSTDDTREIVSRMATIDGRIRLIDNPNRLQSYALNCGIAVAKGDIVVRIDGHVLIAVDYVSQCVRLLIELADQNVVNVGGPMRAGGETTVGQAIAAATQSPFGIPTAFHHSTKAQMVDTVYLGTWPRTVFDKIGPFNPELPVNEDYEFNYRTRMAGGRLYLCPDIHSTYFCRSSYRALWRQYFTYGREKVQMLRRFPASVKPRQLVAPLFVAALVGLPLLSIFSPLILGLWALMLVIYTGVAGVAAWKAPRSDTALFNIVLAFMVMHVAWGSGFWRGVSQPLWRSLTRG